MPKFDSTPYTQLTTPARGDIQGVIKDISETLPENQTKYAALEDLMKYGAWASKVRTVTATGAVILLDTDPIFIEINPNGSNRDVIFPAKGDDNHGYFVHHVGSANTLTLKRSGGATITTLVSGEIKYIKPSTASDFSMLSGMDNRSTYIDGMEIIWNSATSLSVGTGACYAENGNLINITSKLTNSGLSLGSNTWFHLYVYLSSGAPAFEISTTAPAAWKGTAFSKTGDTSRRYVGSVKTDGSGNVYNFEHNPISNLIVYRKQTLTVPPFQCLTNGTATSATSVSLAILVPVTGKSALLSCFNTDLTQPVFVGVATLTAGAFSLAMHGNQRNQVPFMPMDAGQVIYYLYGSAPSSGLYIEIYGYSFLR